MIILFQRKYISGLPLFQWHGGDGIQKKETTVISQDHVKEEQNTLWSWTYRSQSITLCL